jgi:hypothetical protein
MINVAFNENGGLGTYSGAAVLGNAGDVWNGISGNAIDMGVRNSLALVNASGAASGVTLSFAGQTGFFDVTPISAIFQGSPYAALMDQYIYGFPPGVIGSFANLIGGDEYRLIFYSAANDTSRVSNVTVGSSTQTVQDSSAGATFVLGQTYADFTTTPDASGKISFSVFSVKGRLEGDLNGIQLEDLGPAPLATPEPSSLTLLALGTFGLIAVRRSQRQS